LVLACATNGAAFLAYIKPMPCPVPRVGDLDICDNLASHKVTGVREAIEACGTSLRYQPPYRPQPQSDRTGVQQAQASAANSRSTHRRCPLARHRAIDQ
jgi:hypothetical protein